jgi:hypothetical protein
VPADILVDARAWGEKKPIEKVKRLLLLEK